MQGLKGRAIAFLTALVFAFTSGLPASAATTAVVTGVVRGAAGGVVAGAQVELIGPTRMTQQTDAAGKFNFPNVPTGLYALQVTKAGFQTFRDDNVAAFIGETVTENVTLAVSSFSSLRTIASVSTRAAGTASINTSTAAISTISNQAFADQGAQQVTGVLNQTPGIFMTPWNPGNGNPSNGASPSSAQTPQIRGALSYETESLIDGHPVSVGSAGTFSPTLINPFLLQDVELVKGPGSMPVEVNYAINGTVNYRTLDPTPENHVSTMYSVDKWGGISLGIKATGETTNHKLGYSAGYVTFGAPGPLQNYPVQGSQIVLANGPPGGPYYVNGQQLAMLDTPLGEGLAPAQFAPYAGMQLVFAQPLTGCCYQLNAGYHANSQLAKLLYNFSNNTSLKISYLGGQSEGGNGDAEAYSSDGVGTVDLPAFNFQPCGNANSAITCNPLAGGTTYNCTTPTGPGCGSSIPFDLATFNGQGNTWQQQNLFQGEFRTTLGSTGTVLARYYTGSLNTYAIEGPNGTVNQSLTAYGTVPLCPTGSTFNPGPPSATNPGGFECMTGATTFTAPVNTTFNGQRVNFQTVSLANTFVTNDTMSGESLEVQEQLGQDTWTLAYDRSQQLSAETADEPSVGIVVFSPVKGSRQDFGTFSLRGDIPIGEKIQLNLADYQLNYLSHYSIDGGVTFNDSTHTYNAPRAAFTWQPTNNTIYRFSTGLSVAPPYISLVSSGGPTWSAVIGGVPAAGWIQNANNGDISAETAWGYDLGMDHRIARSTSVTLDFYLTQLHNMFLGQTAQVSGAAATGCPNQPCLVSETANLGQARYQGVELGLNHVPLFGFGWKLQGSLQRAYTYNLPPYFYCAGSVGASGPIPPGPGCVYNTNLAVLPNVNFGGQPTAISGAPNGIAGARVPYASGYGELNWVGHGGQYYQLGATYFGNNNVYNEPPFFVLGGNIRLNFGAHSHLQLSMDNLTGVYDNPYVGFFNGIPLPLVKGATQTSLLTGAPLPVSFAATPAGNYGPTSFRLILTQDF
jgi:hypothetical protein